MTPRRVPLRSCVVCRQTSAKKTLLRVVRQSDGETARVVVDPTGKANGRGAYICAAQDCIAKAIKQKRFERSLKVSSVPPSIEEELMRLISGGDNIPNCSE